MSFCLFMVYQTVILMYICICIMCVLRCTLFYYCFEIVHIYKITYNVIIIYLRSYESLRHSFLHLQFIREFGSWYIDRLRFVVREYYIIPTCYPFAYDRIMRNEVIVIIKLYYMNGNDNILYLLTHINVIG